MTYCTAAIPSMDISCHRQRLKEMTLRQFREIVFLGVAKVSNNPGSNGQSAQAAQLKTHVVNARIAQVEDKSLRLSGISVSGISGR